MTLNLSEIEKIQIKLRDIEADFESLPWDTVDLDDRQARKASWESFIVLKNILFWINERGAK